MRAQAIIVHLARAEARRAQAEKLARILPLPADILDAVDGLALPQDKIAAVYRRHLHKPRYPFELRKQEIGCFLSHRKAWRTILDKQLDFGLIVEDDVEVDPPFDQLLRLALAHAKPMHYVRFPRWRRGEGGPLRAGEGGMSIVEPRLPGLGMQMQLVGREAAKALLAFTEQFDRPVDTTIQMRWLHPVRMLSARPVCIREIDEQLGGTIIQKKEKPSGEVLMREIRRPLYRLKVRIRNSSSR